MRLDAERGACTPNPDGVEVPEEDFLIVEIIRLLF